MSWRGILAAASFLRTSAFLLRVPFGLVLASAEVLGIADAAGLGGDGGAVAVFGAGNEGAEPVLMEESTELRN